MESKRFTFLFECKYGTVVVGCTKENNQYAFVLSFKKCRKYDFKHHIFYALQKTAWALSKHVLELFEGLDHWLGYCRDFELLEKPLTYVVAIRVKFPWDRSKTLYHFYLNYKQYDCFLIRACSGYYP